MIQGRRRMQRHPSTWDMYHTNPSQKSKSSYPQMNGLIATASLPFAFVIDKLSMDFYSMIILSSLIAFSYNWYRLSLSYCACTNQLFNVLENISDTKIQRGLLAMNNTPSISNFVRDTPTDWYLTSLSLLVWLISSVMPKDNILCTWVSLCSE